jgi:hypothetical protein
MYVLDKIILTPDMYVLRYHKYIMVAFHSAGTSGAIHGTSPGTDPEEYSNRTSIYEKPLKKPRPVNRLVVLLQFPPYIPVQTIQVWGGV